MRGLLSERFVKSGVATARHYGESIKSREWFVSDKILLCQLIGVDKSEFDIAFDDFPSAVSPLDYYVAPED